VNQGAEWRNARKAALLADAVQLDSLWTWDHLLPVDGPPNQPVFEGWALLAAWAAITRHPTVGLMVGANTLRHPAVVAKAAVTVDHISQGRVILGLGAGSSALEHRAHGIPSGEARGERFAWLEEAIQIIKGLVGGREVTSDPGSHYELAGARHYPTPVRGLGQLRVLVGGSGARKTLPIVARCADLWNPGAPTTEFSYVKVRTAMLDELCALFGRDPADIERTLDPVIMIRPERDQAQRALDQIMSASTSQQVSPPWLGSPEAVADAFRPFMEIGFTHLIAGLPAPYDERTIEGMAEVRRLLSAPHRASEGK
jgi:alkanesulfonate monooxygenase SsuD/methylene tetrahydromethanopterin reductase-like flavin-dependent oxidoreductase (luciferase family)